MAYDPETKKKLTELDHKLNKLTAKSNNTRYPEEKRAEYRRLAVETSNEISRLTGK